MSVLPERLKAARERLGLTQIELGRAIKLSHSTIGKYESGRRDPDSETLRGLCDTLGCSADYLLGRTEGKDLPAQPEEETTTTDAGCHYSLNLGRVKHLVWVAAEIVGLLFRETRNGQEAQFVVGVVKGAVDHWTPEGRADSSSRDSGKGVTDE
jgi:transcriptional regulator with XRE-family HTH domain